MIKAPFSRPVKVDALPKLGQMQIIEANAQERLALAALYDLPAIVSLRAELLVQPAARGEIRVCGVVKADAMQTCVISLEAFAVMIEEPVDARFAPAAPAAPSRAALAATRAAPATSRAAHRASRAAPAVNVGKAPSREMAIGEEDGPDPIIDGKIDLGELAAEHFALALDPYPRKPGVAFAPPPEAR